MNRFSKFLVLSWKERFLLLEAFSFLGMVRALLLLLPFKHIAPYLGRQLPMEDIRGSKFPPSEEAIQIGWAVDVMSRYTPWESTCLTQAIACKFMLRQRGLPSLLYLGTKKDETGQFTAHAWLENENSILLGGGDSESFTVLSAFSDLR